MKLNALFSQRAPWLLPSATITTVAIILGATWFFSRSPDGTSGYECVSANHIARTVTGPDRIAQGIERISRDCRHGDVIRLPQSSGGLIGAFCDFSKPIVPTDAGRATAELELWCVLRFPPRRQR